MIDSTDMKILNCLKSNSRMQWKEIGELVHMTGQAVSARIQKMQDEGVIEAFTVSTNAERLGNMVNGFLIVYMKNSEHAAFQSFLKSRDEVLEAHRISGGGCYFLRISVPSREILNLLLDDMLKYGNYSLSLSIGKIK